MREWKFLKRDENGKLSEEQLLKIARSLIKCHEKTLEMERGQDKQEGHARMTGSLRDSIGYMIRDDVLYMCKGTDLWIVIR